MRPRLYLPDAAPARCFQLNTAQSRHLIKVLRLKSGEAVEIFDGIGHAYPARIIDDDKSRVTVQTAASALPPAPADGGPCVHIGQAVCAAAKMDWAVEKMTELGMASLTPLISDNGKPPPSAAQLARWRRLIIAAAEQCGRNRLPPLASPQPPRQWQPAAVRILLSPGASRSLFSIVSALPADSAIALAIGSESGLSSAEETQLVAAGFQSAHLGARILRAETAGLAALALIQQCPAVRR